MPNDKHLKDQAQLERERCVAICRRRAELWRNTQLARSSSAIARDEARARANEAAYLADLLESGAEFPSVGDDAPDA
jgi:hypothetical protein